MTEIKIEMSGIGRFSTESRSERKTRVLTFQDGMPRVISLIEWHWAAFSWLIDEGIYLEESILSYAYGAALRTHKQFERPFEHSLISHLQWTIEDWYHWEAFGYSEQTMPSNEYGPLHY